MIIPIVIRNSSLRLFYEIEHDVCRFWFVRILEPLLYKYTVCLKKFNMSKRKDDQIGNAEEEVKFQEIFRKWKSGMPDEENKIKLEWHEDYQY